MILPTAFDGRLHGLGRVFALVVGKDDAGAFARECPGDGGANAPAAAGHQCDTTLQPQAGRSAASSAGGASPILPSCRGAKRNAIMPAKARITVTSSTPQF